MPPPVPTVESDAESDDVDAFEDSHVKINAEVKGQLNGELKDEAEKATNDDVEGEEDEGTGDIEHEGGEMKEVEVEEDDDDDDEGDEFNVEAIRKHKFLKGKLHYFIKWLGYKEKDNTWEPREHLVPHAQDLLEAYNKKHSVDTRPPTEKKAKSKTPRRRQASTDDSPAPVTKRQKRASALAAAGESGDGEEEESMWLPSKEDWESLVVKVEAIEKGEGDQLVAFILFNNGKRSRVGMDMVYRHCPRPMLRFYEQHLKFS